MKSAYDNESARCKAYAGQFNIDLFNAAVQLAISTTEAHKKVKEVQRKLNRLPWYGRKDAAAFFEPHGIRYFGELLERYGEKLGDDIANTRAVALAMGWCASLLTENMFVGKQRHDIMKRLAGMTDDLYITVARYLLAEELERRTLHDFLLAWGHKGTESYLRYAAHHARDILGSVLDHTRTLSRKEYRSMLHILGNMVAYDDLPVEMVLAAIQGVSIDDGQEKKGEDE